MTEEQRKKMEDHEAMAIFKFTRHGPHPEIHCKKLHRNTCCICHKTENVFHQGGQLEQTPSQESIETYESEGGFIAPELPATVQEVV